MVSKTVIVTGGAGFIGANLVKRLIKENYKVGLIIKENSNLDRLQKDKDNLSIISANLLDKGNLEKKIRNYDPECIFHLATYGSYPSRQKEENLIYETNVTGTKNLEEITRGIPFINIGSSSEYGLKEEAISESLLCSPVIPYGKAKLEQTEYCKYRNIPTLRFFSVYGPFEDRLRLIPVLINSKINQKAVNLIDSVRDYIHVYDAVESLMDAFANYNTIRGEIINIASGKQISVNEILNIIDSMNPHPLKVDWNFKQIQPEPFKWVANIDKAKRMLNWSPKMDIKEGLLKTYNWWNNEKEDNKI